MLLQPQTAMIKLVMNTNTLAAILVFVYISALVFAFLQIVAKRDTMRDEWRQPADYKMYVSSNGQPNEKQKLKD